MTLPGGLAGRVPGDPGEGDARKIRDLERAIAELRTARSLASSSIGDGGSLTVSGLLDIVDPDTGATIATVGTDSHGTGLRIYRSDGSVLFASMGADALGFNHTTILDRGSRLVVQDDVLHGGLGRPYLQMGPLVDAAPPGQFPPSPTSTAWVNMQTGFCIRWNPQVRFDAIVSSSDPATTGNVQLVDAAANVIGVPIPVPPGAVSYVTLGPLLWPDFTWQPGDAQYLTVQAQRTAGTGAIGVRTTGLWGWAT